MQTYCMTEGTITRLIADFDREPVSYCDRKIKALKYSWANLRKRMRIMFCQVSRRKKDEGKKAYVSSSINRKMVRLIFLFDLELG